MGVELRPGPGRPVRRGRVLPGGACWERAPGAKGVGIWPRAPACPLSLSALRGMGTPSPCAPLLAPTGQWSLRQDALVSEPQRRPPRSCQRGETSGRSTQEAPGAGLRVRGRRPVLGRRQVCDVQGSSPTARRAFNFSPRGVCRVKKAKLSRTPRYLFFLCSSRFGGEVQGVFFSHQSLRFSPICF